MNFKERAKRLKSDIPAIFFALKDKDTPIIAKILAAITVAYALSPVDLIPDFIPVLGYLDDLLILPALAALTIKLIPKEKLEECRKKADGLWENGKPKKWYYALPIVIIWAVVVLGIVMIFI
ncbi:MAG: DUF1232 domain-containing protein [Ruminococcus sp.]|nr:DUF1232 domain-containing protein [Ruminococcus sp.]